MAGDTVDYNIEVTAEKGGKVNLEKGRVIAEGYKFEADIDFDMSFEPDFEELIDWDYNGC